MSDNTRIEWTGATWNPIRARVRDGHLLEVDGKPASWGYHCEHISEGCRNCYAERMNGRMLPAWGTGLEYTRQNREKVEIFLDEEALMQPLRWRKGRKIFPCSMTDLFADFVPDEMIDRVFAVMALTPRHTYQVLTKRASRMLAYAQRFKPDGLGWMTPLGECAFVSDAAFSSECWPLPNVWLGVSVEDQRTADERIPLLLRTPATLRWVSYEPALGPINFSRIEVNPPGCGGTCYLDVLKGRGCSVGGSWDYAKLDWVVIGGESGPGARPFDVAWARETIRQCRDAGVPVFVKQLGAKPQWSDDRGPVYGAYPISVRARKGGDMAEWPEDLRVRQYPEVGHEG